MYLYLLFLCLVPSILGQSIKKRVADGVFVKPNQETHLVKIASISRFSTRFSFCSASVLNTRWLITASHCIHPHYQIIVLSREAFKIAHVQYGNVHLHPDLKELKDVSQLGYDMALLKTDKTIKFTKTVQPIKLSNQKLTGYQTGTMAGYGGLYGDLDIPRSGKVKVMVHPEFPNVLMTRDYVVAESGDSGGSLVVNGVLVGVISSSTTVYRKNYSFSASISASIKWINETIKQC